MANKADNSLRSGPDGGSLRRPGPVREQAGPASLGAGSRKARARRPEKVAVIDIGSNSVRMVIFADAGPVPHVLFNEKVMSGLGRGMRETGLLDPDGVASAVLNLGRFVRLLKTMKIRRVRAVATAAVRDAEDGPAFVERLGAELGLEVEVLDGAEEARFSALGVMSAWPAVDGVMGDLGGGSLELVRIQNGRLESADTLPLGPLRLKDAGTNSRQALAALIDRSLDRVPWLGEIATGNFIAVGGAWRNLARIQMNQTDYPLRVVHGYAMGGRDAARLATLIAAQTPISLKSMPGMSRRRIDVMPEAALVMKKCLERLVPGKVLFSANGLREGVAYSMGLAPLAAADGGGRDPLIVHCDREARAMSRFPEQGREIAAWMAPLFADNDAAEARLRLGACLLSDIGWRHHPDRRAEQTFLEVVHMPTLPESHGDRIFIGLSVFSRYTHKKVPAVLEPYLARLDEQRQETARLVGTAIRLGHTLSGGAPGILADIPLTVTADAVVLTPASGCRALIGDVVRRRFEVMADMLGKPSRIAP